MTFTGFPQTGLDFLTTLGTKNKAWLDENRDTYEADVAGPAKAFVTALGEELQDFVSPDLVASPKTNGSIAPINNDLRFKPDASPYKDHLMFRFWEGANKKTAATLMVRLQPGGGVGFGSGLMIEDLVTWRENVDSERYGLDLQHAIDELAAETEASVVGQGLKRVPKPYDPDHPRGELLKHKWLQVRWLLPVPTNVNEAEFADWCATELGRATELHRILVSLPK